MRNFARLLKRLHSSGANTCRVFFVAALFWLAVFVLQTMVLVFCFFRVSGDVFLGLRVWGNRVVGGPFPFRV